jgi:hypothetical protein
MASFILYGFVKKLGMYPGQNVPSKVSLTQDIGRFFDLVDKRVPDLRYGDECLRVYPET